MEVGNDGVLRKTQKRKSHEMCEDEISRLDEMNQDVLERVLSFLPTSSFYRLTSVCKRWKSVAESATFKLACSVVPHRDPWFLMIDSHPNLIHQPIIFDTTDKNWKKLNHAPPVHLHQNHHSHGGDFIPVAASGGLICFHSLENNEFIIANPVSSTRRHVKPPCATPQPPIRAIAMKSDSKAFKLVLLSGDLPNLTFRQYNSGADQWGEEITLTRKINGPVEFESDQTNDDDCTQYFLTKCGDVVSADIQRSASKQYSSVFTVKSGEEIVHFLSSSGTVVECNLTRNSFFEYPRLLPVFSEYSIDLIECNGEMYVVLLSEFLESATLRVWKWNERVESWRQVAAMPPWMSHNFYGKKVDINCSGAGQQILVCVNSPEICSYVMCDLGANEWVELPQCYMDDGVKEFVCGLSFEPRIEALNM
ncbi:hypothetical protein BUALT_Bualt10G0101000 [Buddleja alternifolia]|uniref:F-box domain-containing protein n=1 Tax=Buddleja alternifolia TaxID=168488 RepID=A0AAV6WYN6_9LAMI|nr:hypothetical protein BUALT_Bualt10G0101000 [Buddleja alternifolia]